MNNGVARRAWDGNDNALSAIKTYVYWFVLCHCWSIGRAMDDNPQLRVTERFAASQELLDSLVSGHDKATDGKANGKSSSSESDAHPIKKQKT